MSSELASEYWRIWGKILTVFHENCIPQKGYNRFYSLYLPLMKYIIALADCVVHGDIPLEYVPQRGKMGTYPWDVYPKTAFGVHIQSVVLQVIDIKW